MVGAAKRYHEGNYESAALELFAAIDATGSKRFPPGTGNGRRFRGLIEQQEDLITYAAVGSCVIGMKVDGLTIAQAVWNYGRNPLDHGAEFEERISFERADGMAIGQRWEFPPAFLLGLMIAVISAKENAGEQEFVPGTIRFGGHDLLLNTLWGGESFLRAIVDANTGGSLSLLKRSRGADS